VSFAVKVGHWFFTASHWHGSDGIPHRVYQHMGISLLAVLAALIVALPFSLWLGHTGRGGFAAISVANAGRAIPSFALLVIGVEVFGIGAKPVFLALFALSVPPIVTNTYTAIRGVDPDVKQAAVGMGMTGLEVLWRVEIPPPSPSSSPASAPPASRRWPPPPWARWWPTAAWASTSPTASPSGTTSRSSRAP
jgi:osmoprotectant transport system permease protein